MVRILSLAFVIAAMSGCSAPSENWQPLFNGENLNGWTPKIKGYPIGENYGNTFSVEDGLLKVSYTEYDSFNNRFGHLFYDDIFSNYRLRLEYRFVGEQCPGGEGWAWRNSGVMVHGQDPTTMDLDQNFPVSIEVQLLGGDGDNERPTGNLCTPGTNVVMDGELTNRHCTNSNSDTYHGDQWVQAEIEVQGDNIIRHIINADTVLSYSNPQLDPDDKFAQKILDKSGPIMLEAGTISLQSESHPIEFRSIEILELPEK
jgi:hypothetical protein